MELFMSRFFALRRFTALLLASALFSGSAYAYEVEWDDPRFPNPEPETKEGQTPDAALSQIFKDSRFRLDGQIWAAFEHRDRQQNGASDPSGPNTELAGFRIGRTYINARGDVLRGPYKGFGFRITFDAIEPAADFGDGCSADGNPRCAAAGNDYMAFLKFAYVTVPLWENAFVRLGQQESALVHAQNGFSLQDLWGHRYLDADGRQELHEFGFTSAAERGVAIVQKHDYFGAELLLSNGEGFRRVNAQDIRRSSVTELAQGAGDSYGMDLFGSLTVRPTGKEKDVEVWITFPFRLRNVTGIAPEETNYITTDASNLANPRYTVYQGDTRAKRDAFWGSEADLIVREGLLEVTLGVGGGVRLDRRGDAYRYDQTTAVSGISPIDLRNLGSNVAIEEDARGDGVYGFIHGRYGEWGGFWRYSEGTSGANLDGTIGVATRKSWLSQSINQDIRDGVGGNLTLGETLGFDLGKSRFQKHLFGITWHANERLRISLGVSRITGSEANGKERRINALDRIDGQGGQAGRALSDQLEQNNSIKSALGLSANDTLDLNDFIGTRQIEQQIFIRSQYLY